MHVKIYIRYAIVDGESRIKSVHIIRGILTIKCKQGQRKVLIKQSIKCCIRWATDATDLDDMQTNV